MWPFKEIADEWPALKPMIEAAPTTFMLLVTALLVAGFGASAWLGHREKKAIKAESEVKDERIKQLKEESERQAKKIAELEKIPHLSTAQRLGFTSTATLTAVIEVITSQSLRIPVGLAYLSEQDRIRLAVLTRAQELGAVKIESTAPTTSTVTPTVSAADLQTIMTSLRWKPPGKS